MSKLTDKNRLSITNPELCKEWDYEKNGGLRPEDVCCFSHKKVWWKDKNGKERFSTIASRNKPKKGRKLDPRKSLAFKYPNLAKEWHFIKNGDLNPSAVSYGSAIKVWWQCSICGGEWTSTVFNRTTNKNGCPCCSGHKVSDKNRLSIKCPELLKEWDYGKNKMSPNDVPVCSTARAWWKCKKGHEWETLIYSRTKGKSNCPVCSNQKADKSNCIATTHPWLVQYWHPTKNGDMTPHNVVIGCEKDVWWICDKGHEYPARPSYKKSNDFNVKKTGERRRRGECPYCNGVIVSKETCLATVNPALAKEWHPTKNRGTTPDNIFPNANKNYWWKCKYGHEWQATANNRIRGNGCPVCNKIELLDGTWWDSYTEAYVYLKFKKRGFDIEPHKKYGNTRRSCDFYLPKHNLYCEITSFGKDRSGHFDNDFWKKYAKKIRLKRKYVVEELGAQFRFIQIKQLKKVQKLQVLREMAK